MSTEIDAAPDTERMLSNRDLRSMYWRSTFLLGSFNFERMQAMGFCITLMPAIRKFYPSNKTEQAAALKRHLEFYNTHPWISSVVFGVTAAMEEQRAKGEDIGDDTITNVKVGLMGPLAGVGDPIFWGTVRPVLGALGASLALTGSWLGPIVYFLGINIIRILVRWYGLKWGYERGTAMVSEVGGGQLKRITQIAAITGLFVMGALVAKWTTINFPGVISSVEADDGTVTVTTLQNILDQLLPGVAALGLTFVCMWLLNKKINALWIILGMFVIGILGAWTGWLGL
ncbi:MAG: PTS system mannose/fructose/sorbose family transporter subunit IID [Actinomyces succiniciruminis]|uniref:Mannose permease IID component n=1 Tax=Actinomyces succiniciruminis TaxID=1522002 RepID=A0A1L7RN67_9ACTO|nr:PTS system mannose/fructose/sorbose family transporter subunit IID [Actinomyces succiniciruminis]MBE6475913.1 PTS system mannose/fructose/sorbose family transporter subunit IID [Actinomyces succiniciruminis]MBM6979117.1 PTS system mannose/fructose/sorbose family transporter subunit IID [Actinomyces succiniciruminis]CED90543.1 Mannose permease IID component [Actinomyces succiniciruminis]